LDIRIKLKQFEGPLDLLLFLVQKNEMAIHDLNLQEITAQYLEMIEAMRDFDMDVAAEFLLMASILVKLKSDTLLPNKNENQEGIEFEEDIQTREELQKRLQEYALFKRMGEKFSMVPKLGEQVFVRPVEPPEVIREYILKTPELTSLIESYTDHLSKMSRKLVPIKSDKVTIKDKVLQLKNMLKWGEQIQFTELVSNEGDFNEIKREVIVSFITILELARLQMVTIYQNESLGPIYVKLKEDLEQLNIKDLTGFDEKMDEAEGEGEDRDKSMLQSEGDQKLQLIHSV